MGKDYVYIWADGEYFRVRLDENRLACLVIIGVLADGTKEVIMLEDGYPKSHESWASLLRVLPCARMIKHRGMPVIVPAAGDGALGFLGLGRTGWGALRDVYPETREQG